MNNYTLIKGKNKFELDKEIESVKNTHVPCGTVVISDLPYVYSLPLIFKEHLKELNKENKSFQIEDFEKKWGGITSHMI
jgi:hypothetical protein